MDIKRIFACCVYCVLCGCMNVAAVDQFILPKQTHKNKKLSKNELKEAIGQEIRDAFIVSTNINKQAGLCQIMVSNVEESLYKNMLLVQKSLGGLHVEVADLQQKFSQLIERLIDNQKPFKKASHDNLDAAFHVLHETKKSLNAYEGRISMLHKHLTKITHENVSGRVSALADLNKTTRATIDEVKKIAAHINSCEGLKVT